MGALRRADVRLAPVVPKCSCAPAGGTAVVVAWTAVWYSGAVVCVITSKLLLERLPNHAWAHTFSQFFITLVFCRIWIAARPGEKLQKVSEGQRLLLLAEGLAVYVGLVSTNTAFGLMNASLVETIKALEPIPSVAIASLMLGEGWAPRPELLALAVIVIGVTMMSYAESTFLFSGLLATLSANFSFSMANNISKVSFQRADRLDALNFWYRSVQVSVLMAAPAAFAEVRANGLSPVALPGDGPDGAPSLCSLVPLVLLNGLAFALYNQATCVVLEYINMTVHSVLNSLRRGVMIIATSIYFGSVVSTTNAMGACIASLGFAAFLAHRADKAAGPPALPTPVPGKRPLTWWRMWLRCPASLPDLPKSFNMALHSRSESE